MSQHGPDALLASLYQWPGQGESAGQELGSEELEEEQELRSAEGQEELVDVEPEEAIRRIEEQVLLFLTCLTSGVQPDFYVVREPGIVHTMQHKQLRDSSSCSVCPPCHSPLLAGSIHSAIINKHAQVQTSI